MCRLHIIFDAVFDAVLHYFVVLLTGLWNVSLPQSE